MTQPICPTGGRPKPDTPPYLILAAAFIFDLLVSRIPWIGPFVGSLSSLAITAETYCSVDPPPMPVWDATDVAQLATGFAGVKLEQTIRHLTWHEYCECSSPPTPPAVIPAPPDPLPVLTPSPSSYCDYAPYELLNFGFFQGFIDVGTGEPVDPRPLPPGATHVTIDAQTLIVEPDAGGWGWEVTVGFWSETVQTGGCVLAPGLSHSEPSKTITCPIPAGSTRWVARTTGTWFGNAANRAFVQIGISCGDPTLLQQECCPPDPTVVARLDRMALDLALIIARLGPVAELQVLSTTPISLEGSTPLVLGARQIRVELAQLGPDVRLVPYAFPDRTRRAATVRFGNDFGWTRRQSVDAQQNLFSVPLDMDVVSWSLSPGTSGTLVQLGQQL